MKKWEDYYNQFYFNSPTLADILFGQSIFCTMLVYIKETADPEISGGERLQIKVVGVEVDRSSTRGYKGFLTIEIIKAIKGIKKGSYRVSCIAPPVSYSAAVHITCHDLPSEMFEEGGPDEEE